MDDDKFNMSMRKFLKEVGVTSQREIERAVRNYRPDTQTLHVKMVLTAAETNLCHTVEGEIQLGSGPEGRAGKEGSMAKEEPGSAVVGRRG
jgi:hypothetical protein